MEKKFLVLEISAFEIDAVNSPDPNENTNVKWTVRCVSKLS